MRSTYIKYKNNNILYIIALHTMVCYNISIYHNPGLHHCTPSLANGKLRQFHVP